LSGRSAVVLSYGNALLCGAARGAARRQILSLRGGFLGGGRVQFLQAPEGFLARHNPV